MENQKQNRDLVTRLKQGAVVVGAVAMTAGANAAVDTAAITGELTGAATAGAAVAAGTGAGSAGNTGGAVGAKVLVCAVNGTTYYIPLCSTNA